MVGRDAFRVELYAVQWEFLVLQAHHKAVVSFRCHLKAVRHAVALHNQAVVARCLIRLGKPLKTPLPVWVIQLVFPCIT